MATIYFSRNGTASSQQHTGVHIAKSALVLFARDDSLYSIAPPSFNAACPDSDVADLRYVVVEVEEIDVTSSFSKPGYYTLTISPSQCRDILDTLVNSGSESTA